MKNQGSLPADLSKGSSQRHLEDRMHGSERQQHRDDDDSLAAYHRLRWHILLSRFVSCLQTWDWSVVAGCGTSPRRLGGIHPKVAKETPSEPLVVPR
jgi:hypothetical protein